MGELIDFLKTKQKVNLCIIAINLVIFGYFNLIGNTQSTAFMLEHGACYAPLVLEYGEYYRLITSIFLHFSIQHILYNMLLLLFLGDALEQAVGKIRYLMIYLGGGICGNLLSLFLEVRKSDYVFSQGRSAVVSAGASGAIFAVLGAVIWLALKHKGRLGAYPLKRLLIMAALSVAEGFTSTGVDNAAHVGGLIAGMLLCMILTLLEYRKAY